MPIIRCVVDSSLRVSTHRDLYESRIEPSVQNGVAGVGRMVTVSKVIVTNFRNSIAHQSFAHSTNSSILRQTMCPLFSNFTHWVGFVVKYPSSYKSKTCIEWRIHSRMRLASSFWVCSLRTIVRPLRLSITKKLRFDITPKRRP